MKRPGRTIVNFLGIDHEMNVALVRYGLVQRQAAGEFPTLDALAHAVGCSRSTISRFFAGRAKGIPSILAILDRLHLTFEQVFTPINLDGIEPEATRR